MRERKAWRAEYDEWVLLTSKPYKHILDDHLCKSPIDLLLAELEAFLPEILDAYTIPLSHVFLICTHSKSDELFL